MSSHLFIHGILDAKLNAWKINPKTRDVKPFVIIKIVPFVNFLESPKVDKPLPVTRIVKVKRETKSRKPPNKNKPLPKIINKYEILSESIETTIEYPDSECPVDVEILPDATPQTSVIVTKKAQNIYKSKNLVFPLKLQKKCDFTASTIVDPNSTIDEEIVMIPNSTIQLQPQLQSESFMIGNTVIHHNRSQLYQSLRPIKEIEPEDSQNVFLELELLKSTITQAPQYLEAVTGLIIQQIKHNLSDNSSPELREWIRFKEKEIMGENHTIVAASDPTENKRVNKATREPSITSIQPVKREGKQEETSVGPMNTGEAETGSRIRREIERNFYLKGLEVNISRMNDVEIVGGARAIKEAIERVRTSLQLEEVASEDMFSGDEFTDDDG
jgi:hypothetical protein